MSNVNIKRAVENIRSNTTVLTPVIEAVVNGIQAIDETKRKDGKILIRARRHNQMEADGSLPEIIGFEIEDNGIGFTETHRHSFDTLYTDKKIKEGGKGFGRFTCLKYFDRVSISSTYKEGSNFKFRKFSMGKKNEIIVDEEVSNSGAEDSGSIIFLQDLKQRRSFDKKLITIARNLVERLLPYFITDEYKCPEVILSEADGTGAINLNDFFRNELSGAIKEIQVDRNNFILRSANSDEDFIVRIFKIYNPRNQKSRISLVAHKREVSVTAIQKYIPEFEDDFFDQSADNNCSNDKNFVIKAYVFSQYLDKNVSLERGGFEFQFENDVFYGISQVQIEQSAAEIARSAVGSDIQLRQEKKRARVQSYVDDQAPWHKTIMENVDLSGMPLRPSNEDIEVRLQREKFEQEVIIRRDVRRILDESNPETIKESVTDIINKVSDTSKNDLIHYIALRRAILEIFGKSLEINESGKYATEGIVHDIIFPRRSNSDALPFHSHNLWLIDERLNFTTWISSDNPLNGGITDRPDLLVYDKRVVFRGDNEPSNPITIFEFKKPQRDDFVNPSSREDPVQQIIRYVNEIRDGKYKTPEGRKIQVSQNTPFYGYVVCDLTPKIENWLEREKDFKPMPDRMGWFQWFGNINLYVEVISWDKIQKDAKMRNQIFFKALGIN